MTLLLWIGPPALTACILAYEWARARRCAWCNRGWAWRRRKAGVRAFPICRRCHRARPHERIRSVRIAHPRPTVRP
jgi:hypothetical protein